MCMSQLVSRFDAARLVVLSADGAPDAAVAMRTLRRVRRARGARPQDSRAKSWQNNATISLAKF